MKNLVLSVVTALGLLAVASDALAQQVPQAANPYGNAPVIATFGHGGSLHALDATATNIDTSIVIDMYAAVAASVGVYDGGWRVATPFTDSVHDFWSGTAGEGSTISPIQFHAITMGNWRDVVVNTSSNHFYMWLGDVGSTNEGNGISFPYRVRSTNTNTLIALSDLEWTITSWDGANSLGQNLKVTQYYREFYGFRADNTTAESGDASTPLSEQRGIGPRTAYGATSSSGIPVISEYGGSIGGLTCVLKVKRGSVVVAMKQLDLPFNPQVFRITQVSRNSLSVADGAQHPSQQYRLKTATTLSSPNWQTISGLPFSSGIVQDVGAFSGPVRFFEAFQGQ